MASNPPISLSTKPFTSPNYPVLSQYVSKNDCGLSILTIIYNLLPQNLKTPLPEIALLFLWLHTPNPFCQDGNLPSFHLPQHFIYTLLYRVLYFTATSVLQSSLTLSSWEAHTPDSVLHLSSSYCSSFT